MIASYKTAAITTGLVAGMVVGTTAAYGSTIDLDAWLIAEAQPLLRGYSEGEVGPHNETYSTSSVSFSGVDSISAPVAKTISDLLSELDTSLDASKLASVERLLRASGITSVDVQNRVNAAQEIAPKNHIKSIKVASADAPGVFSGVTLIVRLNLSIENIQELNLRLTEVEISKNLRSNPAFEVTFARAIA